MEGIENKEKRRKKRENGGICRFFSLSPNNVEDRPKIRKIRKMKQLAPGDYTVAFQ